MSTKTIPAKTLYICDRCRDEGVRGVTGPFQDGGVHGKIQCWSRGYDGAAGGIERQLDLCAACARDFENFLARKEPT